MARAPRELSRAGASHARPKPSTTSIQITASGIVRARGFVDAFRYWRRATDNAAHRDLIDRR